MAWMALRLPETRPPEQREPLSLAWLGAAFGEAMRTRQTLGYTLATGVIFGALMGYVNSAQQIFVEAYGMGGWFPVLFGCVAAALAVASFANSRLVLSLGMRRILACRPSRLRGGRPRAPRPRPRHRAAAPAGFRRCFSRSTCSASA